MPMLRTLSIFLFFVFQAAVPPAAAPQLPHSSTRSSTKSLSNQEESNSRHEVSEFDLLNLSIAILALLISAIAIGYAAKQRRDARTTLNAANTISKNTATTLSNTHSALAGLGETKTSLSELASHLLLIADQLTTRYIGKFPDNLSEITALLSHAKKDILIIVDFAGYSSYTDPDSYRDYFNAVANALQANKKLCAEIYVYDSILHQTLLQLALPRARHPQSAFKKPSDPLILRFKKRMEKRNISVDDYDSFINALLDDESRCIQQFRDLERCDCFELRRSVPIFLWMVDDSECIFAFENEQGKGKNYFSFKSRDRGLIEYFRHYAKNITEQTNQPPSRSVDEVSEMSLLVPTIGLCQMISGKLVPCEYHRDRLDLSYYEQQGDAGERDIDENLIEIMPTKEHLNLFELMDSEKMPAGHWGLMRSHRVWLTSKLTAAFQERINVGEKVEAILQLGTAGPVHYFGTAKIVAEALFAAGLSPDGHHVGFVTRDRCLTPVASVNCLLKKIGSHGTTSAPDKWASIDIEGIRETLDPSFYQIGADKMPLANMLEHNIDLGDVCDGNFANSLRQFDVVIAHFTFSMWANAPMEDCEQGYKNIVDLLKPGGRLLVALSDFHNPAIADVDHYHTCFQSAGLKLVSTLRTWDVYDLSEADRHRFVRVSEPTVFKKRVILTEYVKATG
jgi:SAM-dependent methyltransferase